MQHRTAQGVLAIAIVNQLALRSAQQIEITTENVPRVLGKAVIRGTRIPVELLLRKLSEGASEADLLEAYPQLTRDDIHAAMRYAADALAHEEVVFIDKAKGTRRD
jgi:uncharacterized protein (DUF433 family)